MFVAWMTLQVSWESDMTWNRSPEPSSSIGMQPNSSMTGSLALAICRSSASSRPPFRAAQPHEQPGRGEEPDRYRAHAREPAQRDREMRLAGADGPVEHEIELTRHSGLLQFGKTHISTVYTTQVREHGMLPSTGTAGDSYDNAMAESVNGAYKTELVWRRKPFADLAEPELAAFRWVSWWNSKRLHQSLGCRTPEQIETEYHANQAAQAVSQ